MTNVLERGTSSSCTEHTSAATLEDIQRFVVTLSPFGKARYRLIVIG
jgi:hypothetical protein